MADMAPVPADGGAATGGLGEDERWEDIRKWAECFRGTPAEESWTFIFAEVDRLRSALAQVRAEGAAEASSWASRCASEQVRAERAEAKIREIKRIHVWTNEDGRQFLFADDIRTALGIPF